MFLTPTGLHHRPNLCTIIDLANARAARSVGLPTHPHAFQVGSAVETADGATGRIMEFKGSGYALIAMAGKLAGIRRTAALSTLRVASAHHPSLPAVGRVGVAADDRGPSGDAA